MPPPRIAAVLATLLLAACVHREDFPCPPAGPEGRVRLLTAREATVGGMPSSTGALYVRVTRAGTGKPLGDATVTLHAEPRVGDLTTYLRGARTDGDGVVRWDSVPAGRYGVLFRRIGSEAVRTELDVRAGFADTLAVELRTFPVCLR